jgi:outer membrane protein assembly factor BamB
MILATMNVLRTTVLGVFAVLASTVRAGDWPQFHGLNRDNISTETHLLPRWPDGGPKLLWQADGLGEGWASVAISHGRIYTAGNLGSNTVITALDLTGKRLWQIANGPAARCQFPGARGTPTISGGRLYHLNADGDILCANAETGQRVWSLNIVEKFGCRIPQWGLAESLLVDGNNVICTPGSPTVLVAALDRATGKTNWTTPGNDDKPGYAAPILVNYGGVRQIVTTTSASAIGVDAATGKLLWRHDWPAPFEVNVSQPIYHDGHLALFGTWGRGATLLELTANGVEERWHTTELDNEHGGVVLVDGRLYGYADGNHKHRHWACLDWSTGKTLWTSDELPSPRSCVTGYADGKLYLLTEKGTVALATPRPDKFEIVSQFNLPKQGQGPTWAHPVICDGRLYIRHSQYLYVYDVSRRL